MTPNSDKLKFVAPPKFLRERNVMVIQDCPLDLEVKKGKGYSSQTASGLFAALTKQGVRRTQVHPTYLFNFRPPKGKVGSLLWSKGLPLSPYKSWAMGKNVQILDYAYTELQRLRDEIATVKPKLILAFGGWSTYFLTGESTPARLRGSPYGTLLKYRASYLKLTDWWQTEGTPQETIVMPLLTPSSIYTFPDKQYLINQDYARIKHLNIALTEGKFTEVTTKTTQYITDESFTNVIHVLSFILQKLEEGVTELSIDVETRAGHQDCVGIAWSKTEAICIPFETLSNPYYWKESEEVDIVLLLQEIFLHKNVRHIGQNYSYDMQYFLRDLCLKVEPFIDTMTLQHTLLPGGEKSLDILSSIYCSYHKYWKDDGKTHKGATDEERWIYNADDCGITYEVAQEQKQIMGKSPKNVQEAYKFQQQHLQPNVTKMMYKGVRAAKEKKVELYEQLSKVAESLLKDLREVLGEPDFNPNSWQQNQWLFYNLFKQPKQYNPQNRRVTTNEQALINIKQLEPALAGIIDLYLEYTKLQKFCSTFLGSKLDEDERFRCLYHVSGTDTFRLSSTQNAFGSGLNLQTIPAGGTTSSGMEMPNVKELFLADEGYKMFDSDFDSADLRIVVARAKATELQQLIDEGVKVYVHVMQEYYHDTTLTKKSPQYRTFKAIVHGSNYLGSAAGLAGRTGLLVHEVERVQKFYFGIAPEIKRQHKELEKQVKRRGWIENIFGYRRYFLNMKFPTLMQVAAAWEPQSTIGILVNKGMDNIMTNHPDIDLLLQVHDSLVGQYKIGRPNAREDIISAMEIELPFDTPITIPVDMVTGSNWAECK